MEECLLIDSDVLIDYLRGHPAAISYLEGLTERQIISVMKRCRTLHRNS